MEIEGDFLMETRNILVEDYYKVIEVIDDWWGGRPMTHLLPRLFFEHFQSTSYVIEHDNELVAFIIGFISQTNPQEAYIHFVGVSPQYRSLGYANDLYQLFFNQVRQLGCNKVRCITTPINTGSVAFHEKMGFTVQLVKDYAGDGQDRILFSKQLV